MLNGVIQYILDKIRKNYNDVHYIDQYINSLILNMYFYNKIRYLINKKGKRLRSMLSLYYYHKYSNGASYSIEELYIISAIVEITHFASLLHDDVIDNSCIRRGEKSYNYLYGNKNSILIGDYLLINVFNNLLKILNNKHYGQYIINQFIKASTDTAYGAYLEHNLVLINNNIIHSTDNNLNIENYIRIAKLKTGSLFKFSCMTGCILSNTCFNNTKPAASFGTIFSIIYQIQNDLDDYQCNNYTESEDYMQSNITLPIIILQGITDITKYFNNKNQINFDKIKQLIGTEEFKHQFNQVVSKYVNSINSYM